MFIVITSEVRLTEIQEELCKDIVKGQNQVRFDGFCLQKLFDAED